MKNISLNEIENEIRSLVDEHIKDETTKEKFIKSAFRRIIKRYYGWGFNENLSPNIAICIKLFPEENKMYAIVVGNSHPYRPNDPKGYNFEIGLFLDKREGVGTGYNWYNYTYYKII